MCKTGGYALVLDPLFVFLCQYVVLFCPPFQSVNRPGIATVERDGGRMEEVPKSRVLPWCEGLLMLQALRASRLEAKPIPRFPPPGHAAHRIALKMFINVHRNTVRKPPAK